jgi:hypothetical protein
MAISRLSRPNQTWALALRSSFVNPSAPTVLELNDRRFVHLISCALTEDGTELTLGDSETDDTITFCSIGNESTPTFYNPSATLTWLKDANTGGSGSTADLTSLYNKVEAMLGSQDIPYLLISRTGPNASQDINFAVGHVIKMASFMTDYPQLSMENNSPVRGVQSLLFDGAVVNWNYTIAA